MLSPHLLWRRAGNSVALVIMCASCNEMPCTSAGLSNISVEPRGVPRLRMPRVKRKIKIEVNQSINKQDAFMSRAQWWRKLFQSEGQVEGRRLEYRVRCGILDFWPRIVVFWWILGQRGQNVYVWNSCMKTTPTVVTLYVWPAKKIILIYKFKIINWKLIWSQLPTDVPPAPLKL